MPGTVKKSKSNEKDINQQLYNTIYTKVTAENYQENQDETAKECKRLFKQGASPETLAKLEEILRERQNGKAITKQLKSSKLGASPEALAELQKSVGKKREHYNNYIQHFLPALLGKITQSKKLEKAKEIGRIISEIISKSSNKYSKIEEQPINSIKEEIPVSSTGMTENNVESPMTQDQTQQELESLTKEEVCASDSDSGMGSRELSATSTLSEESLNSTLSSTEEDNGLQPEDEGETKLAHLTKTRSTGPSGRRSPSKYKRKIEDQMQPEQAAPGEPQVQEKEELSQCLTPESKKKKIWTQMVRLLRRQVVSHCNLKKKRTPLPLCKNLLQTKTIVKVRHLRNNPIIEIFTLHL